MNRVERKRSEEEACQLRAGQGQEPGGYVVEHDASAGGETFELADGRRLEDVEDSEEDEGYGCVTPVSRDRDEGDELTGNFVDDNVARVFAA
jgi:hypothetical protein